MEVSKVFGLDLHSKVIISQNPFVNFKSLLWGVNKAMPIKRINRILK
jgi:hypothetical protein